MARRLFGSGAGWAVVWLICIAGNLPRVAYYSPAYRYASWHFLHDTTLTLGAIHKVRRAHRRGHSTLLIAGTSVVRHLPLEPLQREYAVAKTLAQRGGLPAHAAFTRVLIDAAPADVVLVPLLWPSIPAATLARVSNDDGSETEWRRGAGEYIVYQRYAYGHPYGLPTLVWRVLEENVRWARVRAARRSCKRTHDPRSLAPIPNPDATPKMRAYYERIGALSATATVPKAAAFAKLESLRAYGARRGVTVLYYLSPHNPGYFDSLIDPQAFERFRAALRPHLFLDLGTLLPRERFRGDLVHFNFEGGEAVAAALADALAERGAPDVPRAWGMPSPRARLANALAEWRFGYAAATVKRDLAGDIRASWEQFVAEFRLQASQYPRYLSEVFRLPTRPPPDAPETPPADS